MREVWKTNLLKILPITQNREFLEILNYEQNPVLSVVNRSINVIIYQLNNLSCSHFFFYIHTMKVRIMPNY